MNLVSATTEIDPKDHVSLWPAHNHIEAVYDDGGVSANISAAVMPRLRPPKRGRSRPSAWASA